MSNVDQAVRPHPQVVDTELDGQEVVLLHLESKMYYSLNVTGTRIWQGLKQGLTLQGIRRRLEEEFEVDADRADRSVGEFVEELFRQGLVQASDRLDQRPRRTRSPAL